MLTRQGYIIERTFPAGAWCLSAIVDDQLFSQTYYGYTRREAIAEFTEYLAAERAKIVVEKRS